MKILGLHITTVRRHKEDLKETWKASGRAHLALTPAQAAMVLADTPPREIDLGAEVLIGFPAGNRRGVADGWKSSR